MLTFGSFSSVEVLSEFSLWLWLWFVWVTAVLYGPPAAAADWAPKQQKNEEKMFRFLGFLVTEEGTAEEEKYKVEQSEQSCSDGEIEVDKMLNVICKPTTNSIDKIKS